MIAAAAHSPSSLWYLSRGSGAVTLVLLTVAVVLGVGEVRLWRPGAAPRFAVASVHRTVSLLAVVFLAVHVLSTLLDTFPHIGVLNAVLPFQTTYRPLWMALGTLASDLLLAVIITSLVRRRLGYRTWRGVHWAAYACWPIAVLHGLGTGSDTGSAWMLGLTLACIAAVTAALVSRLRAPGLTARVRTGTAAAMTACGLGLLVWLPVGPLASGWARRAGTPASVLTAFAPRTPVRALRPARPDPLRRAFLVPVSGPIHTGTGADGTGVVDLSLRTSGSPDGVLRVRLGGNPVAGGGLQMTASAVTFGPPDDPGRYRGRIQFLQGSQLRSLVGSADGHALRLILDLSLGQDSATGQLRSTPVTGTGP